MGDSVTQGAVGHHTWRYFFAQAHPEVDFVGNKRGTFSIYGGDWDYRGANAYAVSGWDSDHAAVWGGSIGNADPDPKLHQLPIGDLARDYQPDVIVSAWGINDLNKGATPASLVASYAAWVEDAREQQPDVDFVISELAWTWGTGASSTKAADFNAMLDGFAEEHGTEESRIIIARMSEDYTQADTYDGIHPNQSGEEKIARMIGAAYAKVTEVAVAPVPDPVVVTETPAPTPAPEPTAIVTPQPEPSAAPPVEAAPESVEETFVPAVATPSAAAPAAPRGVRAEARGERVRVVWQPVAGAGSYRVKCGGRAAEVSGTRAVLRTGVARCKVRALSDTGASAWSAAKVQRPRR